MTCVTFLNELGKHKIFLICWIPCHKGHYGNEMEDCLANKGAPVDKVKLPGRI